MTSEITEITEIKEGRSPDRPAAPWEKSFRGWILYDGLAAPVPLPPDDSVGYFAAAVSFFSHCKRTGS